MTRNIKADPFNSMRGSKHTSRMPDFTFPRPESGGFNFPPSQSGHTFPPPQPGHTFPKQQPGLTSPNQQPGHTFSYHAPTRNLSEQERQREKKKERERKEREAERQREIAETRKRQYQRQLSDERRAFERRQALEEQEKTGRIVLAIFCIAVVVVVAAILLFIRSRRRRREKKRAEASEEAIGTVQQSQVITDGGINPFGVYGPAQVQLPPPSFTPYQYQPQPIYTTGPSSPTDLMDSSVFSPPTSYNDAPPAYNPGTH